MKTQNENAAKSVRSDALLGDNIRFYTTFSTQIEVLPRLTIIYGSLLHGNNEIMRGVAIEWLWLGVFIGS